MEANRILVTGATGFVGQGVTQCLAEAGYPLTLAIRRPLPPSSHRVVEIGSIGALTEWREALRHVCAVVHLAAHVHVAPERASAESELFDEVNHRGAVRLFSQALVAGVSTFVFVSSSNVLGSGTRPGSPYRDTTPPAPETPYGLSKLAAEDALTTLAAGSVTTCTILRPPLVCGPGVGGNLGSLARLAAGPLPLPLGGIDNRRTLISRDNLASAILAVLRRPRAGRFVLGDREPLSTSDIVRHLREGAGRASRLLPMPTGLVRRLAHLLGRGAQADRLLGDLDIDAGGFRSAFAWEDVVDTATVLRRTGAAARAATLR